uniref:Uncharacterized protein n=1 Tax=Panagrolaimus davidi TaxID=227884 RepID=A0A914PJN6_9BILA
MLKEYLEERIKMRQDVKAALEKARIQVNSMEGQNRQKQSILNEIIQQKNKTETAIKELEGQVNQAKKVLQDIESYANGTSDLGKAAFIEALSEVDEIEANIEEANNKTMETKKLIGNSKELADAALATAIEAQKQAENLAFQSEQLAEAVETLAESATKTDQGLRNIDDLLLILNKSSIALENARERRKNSEAELQQAALLELKAKNESEKMDKLEEIVRGIQINIGKFI